MNHPKWTLKEFANSAGFIRHVSRPTLKVAEIAFIGFRIRVSRTLSEFPGVLQRDPEGRCPELEFWESCGVIWGARLPHDSTILKPLDRPG